MRYLTVDENGKLRQKTRVEIDTSKYTVIEKTDRYQVSQSGQKYLIDFGFGPDQTVATIVCDNSIELLYALPYVRQAFPNAKKWKS